MRLKGDEPKRVLGQGGLRLEASLLKPVHCMLIPTHQGAGPGHPLPPQRGRVRPSLVHRSEQETFSSTMSLLFMETGGCFKSLSYDLHLTCMSL